MLRRLALTSTLLLAASVSAQPARPSATSQLLDLALEAQAREVARVGARPTIDARELFLLTAAMYDASTAYDDTALGSHGVVPRQKIRTEDARRRAMLTALGLVLYELYPAQKKWLDDALRRHRYTPKPVEGSPEFAGAIAGRQLLEARRHDGANQLGDEAGGDGQPFADYTYYRPDASRFLTPHWYRVTPFALASPSQFRPPPPPADPKEEVDEVVRYVATLSPEQRQLVDFTHDGSSARWLRIAQAVSRRDKNAAELDARLFFTVAAACFDALIAAWEAKRNYDSPRPAALVQQRYAGKKVRDVPAEKWAAGPAESASPGYVSAHSAVAAAAARTLQLFTDSDVYDDEATRPDGETPHVAMAALDGRGAADAGVPLQLATFTRTAELMGISRVMNGSQLQSDHLAGLALGRKVADVSWVKATALFAGKPVDTRGK